MTGSAERLAWGAWALVVSGDGPLRAQARLGLREAGLRCEDAVSGRAGLALVEEPRRDYVLVVLDLELPDLSAVELQAIASITLPQAAYLLCGLGPVAPPGIETRRITGPVWMAKPCAAADFAGTIKDLRNGIRLLGAG